MKTFLLFVVTGLLCGCQTAAPKLKLPRPVPEPLPIATTSVKPAPIIAADSEVKLRQSAQLVEALMSQNDALAARLHEAEDRKPSMSVEPTEPAHAPIPSTVSGVSHDPLPSAHSEETASAGIAPNADGLIDLAAVEPSGDSEVTNPFAVRGPSGTPVESKINVQGVVWAEGGPCALVNDRLISVGETVDRWRFMRMEPDALIFSASDQILRLPFAETRVRHT